jgi:hypothetical protein
MAMKLSNLTHHKLGSLEELTLCTNHDRWHNQDPKFNDVWEDFFYGPPVNGIRPEIKRTQAEVLHQLQIMRALYQ